MRLHIARNREQQYLLERVFPEDKVVCFRDTVHGLRVDAIIQWPRPGGTLEEWDQYHTWFDQAVLCRLEPEGTVLRV